MWASSIGPARPRAIGCDGAGVCAMVSQERQENFSRTCDLGALEEDFAHEPSSAQASDPAVDALEITPVHHAIAGGHVEAPRVLLARALDAKESLRGAKHAFRMAVSHENVAIVATLLDHVADATAIRACRVVIHPELAPMLSRAGACITGRSRSRPARTLPVGGSFRYTIA